MIPAASTAPPEWRKNAPAGQTLATVQAKAAALLPGGGNQSPVTSNQPAVPAAAAREPLQLIIRPSARDRWMGSEKRHYTPQLVEATARSAMSGNLMAVWLMFDLMEQTWGRLSKNLNELKGAVIDLDWNLQPYAVKGQKPSAEATRRANLLEAALFNMRPDVCENENDFDDTLYDLMDAVGKGVSVVEIDWTLKDGLWQPRGTRWVHPRHYGWPGFSFGATSDQQDRLMLFAQEVAFNNPDFKAESLWQEFPQDQFLISVFKQKSGHPINASLLRILGFFWAAQNFTWEWFLNLAQIFGMPFRWSTYDASQKGLLDTISDMMTRMGSMGWGVFPDGTKLEFKEGIQNAQNNPQKVFIDMADEVCDLLVIGETRTSHSAQRGTQALESVRQTGRNEQVHRVAGKTAKILNHQLLPALCRKNFGNDQECPWLQPAAKEAKDALANAERDQVLLQSGMPLPKQWLYERHDVPPPQAGEEVITGPANPTGPGGPGGEPLPGEPGGAAATATARARAASEQLTDRVMENLTSVQAKWLAGVKPVFRRLVAAAQAGTLTDQEFITEIAHAKKHFPELMNRLDRTHLASAMEKAMGAAAVNGAVSGMMRRGVR